MNLLPSFRRQPWVAAVGVILLLALGYSISLLFSRPSPLHLVFEPRIVEMGRYSATIYYETGVPTLSSVSYQGPDGRLRSVVGDEEKITHTVTLTGLMPETVYSYQIGQEGETYYLRTAAMTETPFRFLVYGQELFNQENTARLRGLILDQYPDFVILTGDVTSHDLQNERNFFAKLGLGSEVPIFLSPSEDLLGRLPQNQNGSDFAFDYGNSRFVVLGNAAQTPRDRQEWLYDTVVAGTPTHVFVIGERSDLPLVDQLWQEERLTAVFRAVQAQDGEDYPLANMFYILDVDGQGVEGLWGSTWDLGVTQAITIREVPEAVRRTCVYCRKLLEAERYHESIQWYRDFIAEFGERHLVDNAQFEIANIYDRYLFDYPNAIREYQILLQEYPESNRVRQSLNRLSYLQAHSDHGFEPLRIFETAKTLTFQVDRKKAIQEVESILEAYPDSSLMEQILFWLGYALTGNDLRRAVRYFGAIIENYTNPSTLEAAWIGMGDAYYQGKRYPAAINSYNEAVAVTGNQQNFGLLDKIWRSQRNIRREVLLYLTVFILTLSLLASLAMKPRWFALREVLIGLYLGLFYLVIGGLLWALFASSYPELIRVLLVLIPSVSLAHMVTMSLGRKLLGRISAPIRIGVTTLIALLLNGSVVYLLMYYFHYLPVFHL